MIFESWYVPKVEMKKIGICRVSSILYLAGSLLIRLAVKEAAVSALDLE